MFANVFDFEKSFREVTIAQVNNMLCVNEILASRSLLVMNSKTGKAWNVIARIRQVDSRSMLKAMMKIVLSAIRDRYEANHTENAINSKRNCEDPFAKIMSCDVIYATDKSGALLPDSEFKVINELQHLKIRQIFKATKRMPIYDLYVIQKLEWGNPQLDDALNVWADTVLEQTNIVRKFHESFRKAAVSNDPLALVESTEETAIIEVKEVVIEDAKESGVA